MILDLLKDASFTLGNGRLADDLAKLARAHVRVIPSALLPANSFYEWRSTGRVNDTNVDQLLTWVRSNEISPTAPVRIRPSTIREYCGLLDDVSVRPNFAEVYSAIDRIYRSWGDERARASRLTHEIDEPEGCPSVLVQPRAENVYSVLTRHATKGTLTTSADFDDNVNNRVPRFSSELEDLIRACDTQLRRPLQIQFTSDDECSRPTVVSLCDQEMTDGARLRVLADLVDGTAIDELEFLMGITPNMIGVVHAALNHAYCVKGAPASPGLVQGKLVFRKPKLPDNPGALVLCIDELSPKDLDLLKRCAGAFSLQGGMTSHLAVVSRGMDKPAVTGCGGKLDLRKRAYYTDGGLEVKEFASVLVDGGAGMVGYAESALSVEWVRSNRSAELLDKIVGCCNRLSPSEFKRLSVKTQLHIASLKNRLREIGMLK